MIKPTMSPQLLTVDETMDIVARAAAGSADDLRIVSALIAARVPSRYHAKTRSFETLGTPNAPALANLVSCGQRLWVNAGGLIEFTYDGSAAMDEFYMMARALLLHAISPIVLPLNFLWQGLEERTLSDTIKDHRVLCIPGMMGKHWTRPLSEEAMHRIEWFLREWVLDCRPLIIQGECPLEASPWWTKGFVDVIHKSAQGYVYKFDSGKGGTK